MGVYAITGASSGIGAKTKELLLQKGHEVINIDLKDGDICVNLATPEGRQAAVDKLHELHPEGLDGMIFIVKIIFFRFPFPVSDTLFFHGIPSFRHL